MPRNLRIVLRGLSFILALFLYLNSSLSSEDPDHEPLDSESIEIEKPLYTEPSLFVGGLVLEFPVYSFFLGSPDIDGKAYVPNVPPRLGPRIAYEKLGFRATFALPLPTKEKSRRGSSKQRNLNLSFYLEGHAFYFYYQSFKGFYMSSPLLELRTDRQDRFTQLPDARSRHWGLNWYYNLHNEAFSMSSAFDSTDFRIQEGDSIVVIPFFRHWEIDLGNTIIKGSEPDDPDTIPDLASGKFNTAGASFAYVRSWTKENYYISGLGGLGPALQHQRYTRGDQSRSRIRPAAKANFNLSIGKKKNDHSYGANFIVDSIYTRIAGLDVYTSFVAAEAFYNRSF